MYHLRLFCQEECAKTAELWRKFVTVHSVQDVYKRQNVVYAFLTSFMMVYLTDSVGLAAGVVGTLIAVSKLFDGFTDIFRCV